MEIKPLIGFDDVRLGMSKEDVRLLKGDPITIEEDDWSDDSKSETWIYSDPDIDFRFDSDSEFKLSTITVRTAMAKIGEINPIGLSEDQLRLNFPSIELDEDFEENGKDYLIPGQELSFWVVDGVVDNVTIFPKYDDTGNIPLWPVKLAGNMNVIGSN